MKVVHTCEASSSSNMILTTTTLMLFPMLASRYNADTMFMMVSMYVSTSPSWWKFIMEVSATSSASTWRSLLTERLHRVFLDFPLPCTLTFPICCFHSSRVSIRRLGSSHKEHIHNQHISKKQLRENRLYTKFSGTTILMSTDTHAFANL